MFSTAQDKVMVRENVEVCKKGTGRLKEKRYKEDCSAGQSITKWVF